MVEARPGLSIVNKSKHPDVMLNIIMSFRLLVCNLQRINKKTIEGYRLVTESS